MSLYPIPLTTLVLLAFSACSIERTLPLARFELPEVPSEPEFDGEFRGFLTSDQRIVISDDTTSSRQPLLDAPAVGRSLNIGGGAKFVFIPRFELGIDINPFALSRLVAKYQLLGDTLKQAKQGNFSIALLAGGWSQDGSEATDQGLFGGQAKSRVNYSAWEGMLIVGYRMHDLLLIYGGPGYYQLGYSGTLQTTNRSNVVVVDRAFSGKARAVSFNLGLNAFFREGGHFFMRGEIQYSSVRAGAGPWVEGVGGGIALGSLY